MLFTPMMVISFPIESSLRTQHTINFGEISIRWHVKSFYNNDWYIDVIIAKRLWTIVQLKDKKASRIWNMTLVSKSLLCK